MTETTEPGQDEQVQRVRDVLLHGPEVADRKAEMRRYAQVLAQRRSPTDDFIDALSYALPYAFAQRNA